MNNFIVILFLIPILSFVLLAINFLFSIVNPDEAKVSPFECGFNSLTDQTRTIFHIHFFIVALLFLIFDLEILLLFPVSLTLYKISTYGFAFAIIFFIILTVGFALEIGYGAISLEKLNLNSNLNNIKNNL